MAKKLMQVIGVAIVGVVLLAAQVGILVFIVRWTCQAAARKALRREREKEKFIRSRLGDLAIIHMRRTP